jgi:hypothetical protein
MSTDAKTPLELRVAYEKAMAAFNALTGEIDRFVTRIAEAAQSLRGGWRNIIPAGRSVEGLSPTSGAPTIGMDWPSGQDLAAKLMAWHKAKSGLQNVYNAVPSDERAKVKPPPY